MDYLHGHKSIDEYEFTGLIDKIYTATNSEITEDQLREEVREALAEIKALDLN